MHGKCRASLFDYAPVGQPLRILIGGIMTNLVCAAARNNAQKQRDEERWRY
jgi:hypothetical protein